MECLYIISYKVLGYYSLETQSNVNFAVKGFCKNFIPTNWKVVVEKPGYSWVKNSRSVLLRFQLRIVLFIMFMGFSQNQYLQNFSYILYFIYFLNFILFYTTLSLPRHSLSYIIRETLRYFQKYIILIDTCVCFKYILKQIIVSRIFQVLICVKHSSKCLSYIDVFNFYNNFYGIDFSSVAQCVQLCNPKDCSTPGLPVHHQLLELTQTHVHWDGDAT